MDTNKAILDYLIIMMISLIMIISNQLVGQTVSPCTLTTDWYFGQAGRLIFPNGSFLNSATPTVSYNAASAQVHRTAFLRT